MISERAEVVIANTELEPITDQGKLQAWDAICMKVNKKKSGCQLDCWRPLFIY